MLVALLATPARADMMVFEDFAAPAGEWFYVSDRVMGGVSDGGALLQVEGERTFARLEGQVSTANNGGFIQIRRDVDGLPPEMRAIGLRVRGNGERYYIHLRTTASRRPWEYFQASFPTTGAWQEVTVPLTAFEAEGRFLTRPLNPAEVTSVGLVAYGKNMRARLDVARITFSD